MRLSPAGLACPNACLEIGTISGPVFHVRNNILGNFTAAQSGSAKHYGWVTPSASSIGPPGSISDRNALFVANPGNGYTGRAGSIDRPTLNDWRAVVGSDAMKATLAAIERT